MKKPIRKLIIEELREYPIRDHVPGWFFRIDEIAQGFYMSEGIDLWGRKVSRTGIDPEKLLLLIKMDVAEMMQSLGIEASEEHP